MSSTAPSIVAHGIRENVIHGSTTSRLRSASSSPAYLTRGYSFYSRPRSFKTEHTTYVKNGRDKRLYKSLSQLFSQINRCIHSRRRRRSGMRRLASSIRGGLYNRQLRRSLRRRNASAIAAAWPAASRPQAYSPRSQPCHGFNNPITTPCSPLRSPTFVTQKIWRLQAKDRCDDHRCTHEGCTHYH